MRGTADMDAEDDPHVLLLRDLGQLDEGARNRYLERCSQEDKDKALLAAVQGEYRVRNEPSRGTSVKLINAALNAHATNKRSRMEFDGKEPTLREPKGHSTVVTKEAMVPKKRSRPAATTKKDKRAKIATTTQPKDVNSPLPQLTRSREDSESPMRKLTKKDMEMLDRDGDGTDGDICEDQGDDLSGKPTTATSGTQLNEGLSVAHSEKDPGQTIVRKFKREFPIFVPDKGYRELVPIEWLPLDVRTEIQQRHEKTMKAKSLDALQALAQRYESNLYPTRNNPLEQLFKPFPFCILGQLISAEKPLIHDYPSAHSMLTREKDGHVYADDGCVSEKQPCLYLIWNGKQDVLRLVPLPAKLRVGKTWKDLEFWVQA